MKQISLVIAIFLSAILTTKAQDFVFTPINVQQGLSDNQIRYILQLPDGRMVFKTSGNINIYNGTRFKYIHQQSEDIYPLAAYQGFYRIYQGTDSTLWIKDNRKLMCVDLRTEKYIPNLGSYFKKIGFKPNIDDLFMDSDQRFWLLSGNRLALKDHSKTIPLSNHQGILQDVASTKENVFLFYHTGVVSCYNLKSKNSFNSAAYPIQQQKKFERTSLVVRGNNGFYQLRNGSMGGFFFFDTEKRSWEKILETTYTLNTLVLRNGIAYISCSNGMWIIDHQKGKKQYIPILKKRDGNLLETEVSTVFYDKQDGLWLGTLNQGLLYYHPLRYTFSHIGRTHFPRTNLKDIVVLAFAEDELGNIFLKCKSGIYLYRPSTQNNMVLEPIAISSLSKKIIQALDQPISTHTQVIDVRGWEWTATADGLKLFDPRSNEKRTFYTSDGLSNNFIHAIFQDRQQQIWITTSYGINKLQVDATEKKISFLNYSVDAGALEGEYTDGAVFESANGTLYFGGINGFSLLHQQQLRAKKLPFKPIFTNLFLHGEQIEPNQFYNGRKLLTHSAAFTKNITLAHHQNFLTFEFSAVNYQTPSQTHYRYQLEGIDQQWKETKGKLQPDHINNNGLLSLSYTNLPYGKYKLKVMASNSNQNWTGPISVLYVTILPPWWKTTLAFFLFTTIALTLILTVLYFYMRNAKEKLERTHREEVLLIRIRNLIDQQKLLQTKKDNQYPSIEQKYNELTPSTAQNQTDAAFLAKALAQVEKHINIPNYSVEQLSRDLHMDRTGLYRKLVTLLDKSPSLFIRNIRLEKAAELLLKGELNISEIVDKVGFSSSSYFSKCFQEQYGCKPSEYAEKTKKST